MKQNEPEGSWLLNQDEKDDLRMSQNGPEGSWLLDQDEKDLRMSQNDMAELQAWRAASARQAAKYRGWKPLPIWYTFWAILFAVGGLVSGNVGTTLTGLVIAGLLGWYVHYLYSGGKHRVWFIIF